MELLIAVNNPFPGMEAIEIFEPEQLGFDTLFPVKIDNVRYNFSLEEHGHWKPIEAGANLSDEVCWFVGDLIDKRMK